MLSYLTSRTRLNSLLIKECSSSKFTSCRTGSTRKEKICAYSNKPSSMSVRHTHMAGDLERELAMSIVASTRIGRLTPLVFGRASQNIVTTAMLLRNMPEPSNPDARRARDEIRELLETAAM
jgi:hypothetical protein